MKFLIFFSILFSISAQARVSFDANTPQSHVISTAVAPSQVEMIMESSHTTETVFYVNISGGLKFKIGQKALAEIGYTLADFQNLIMNSVNNDKIEVSIQSLSTQTTANGAYEFKRLIINTSNY